MEQLFEAMMGGMGGGGGMFMGPGMSMGGGRGSNRRRRGEDVGIAHPVTLEELYTGCEVTVPRERTVICTSCHGSGAKRAGSTAACKTCRGQGEVLTMREVAPGFVARAPGPCPSCNGQGSTVADKDKCDKCKGRRMCEEHAPLVVKILPGMRHGEQIPFMGMGDEDVNVAEPGDVVVVLQCKEHPTFTREGDNLRMKLKISLAESLCGAALTFRHLDGRSLHVRPPAGRLIEPESCFCLRGEGMPVINRGGHRNQITGRKGDLYIDFDVQFPRHLTPESVALLKKHLPAPVNPKPKLGEDEEHEECYATPQPLADVRKQIQKEVSDDDSDDEGRGGGGGGGRGGRGGPGGVRCAHA